MIRGTERNVTVCSPDFDNCVDFQNEHQYVIVYIWFSQLVNQFFHDRECFEFVQNEPSQSIVSNSKIHLSVSSMKMNIVYGALTLHSKSKQKLI